MGIKYFYSWHKKNFSSCFEFDVKDIDVLAIDLNGLFHNSAQKIFKYGNMNKYLNESKLHLLPKTNLTLYREVCEKIEHLRNQINPSKKLIMCVDGVAGLGKIIQQRQRRFKSSATLKESCFDPNCFTPGTKIMDHLTKYIDWYIRTMITLNPHWQKIEVVFSNEKVPGEGEHKIINFIKKFCQPEDRICVYGHDTDLLLLGLIIPFQKFYILRDQDVESIEFVNIDRFKKELCGMLDWMDDKFEHKRAIIDFVMISFLVGNDFLPNIPTLYILEGCFDLLVKVYKDVCKINGHLTLESGQHIVFNKASLAMFFLELGKLEKSVLENKYNSQQSFFPDPLIIKNMRLIDDRYSIDIDNYKIDYYESKFCHDRKIDRLIREYLNGMYWIINYYHHGIPDWNWFYPHHYGPFLSDFYSIIHNSFEYIEFNLNKPITPFLQLLMVLPKDSADLLPYPINKLLNPESSLGRFFPESFEIDFTGKYKEWEGVVIVPIIDVKKFIEEYMKHEKNISYSDRKRNIVGKNFIYKYDEFICNFFRSFYGNIYECPVSIISF